MPTPDKHCLATPINFIIDDRAISRYPIVSAPSWWTNRQRRELRRKLVGFLLKPIAKKASNHVVAGPVETVAIIRPNHRLGNILMLTPLVTAIENQWPEAKIDIIGGGRLDDIFKAFPSIRNCIQAPEPAIKLIWDRVFRKKVRHQYDVAINIDSQSHSAKLITKIIDATSTVEPQAHHSRHMALAPLDALSECLGSTLGPPWPELSVRLSDQEKTEGRHKLKSLLSLTETKRPLIGLYPFANKGRDYPLAWWAELISALRKAIPQAYLIEILPAHGQKLLPEVDGAFLTLELREFASQLHALDAVIATDGGVMHLASASETLTWGLFKVTDPEVYAPYGGHNRGFTWDQAKPKVMADALRLALADHRSNDGLS